MGFAMNVASDKVCRAEVSASAREPLSMIVEGIEKALMEALMTNASSISNLMGGSNPEGDSAPTPAGIISKLNYLRALSVRVMESSHVIRELLD